MAKGNFSDNMMDLVRGTNVKVEKIPETSSPAPEKKESAKAPAMKEAPETSVTKRSEETSRSEINSEIPRKVGRPPAGYARKQISLYLPEDVYEILQTGHHANGENITDYIVRLLRDDNERNKDFYDIIRNRGKSK